MSTKRLPQLQWKFPLLPTLLALGADSGLTEYHTGRTKMLCPFHDERRASATVNWDKQAFHCFACGVRGDAVDLWQTQGGLSRAAARTEAETVSGGRDQSVHGTAGVRGVTLFD
jgi:hypothetical protein